MPLNCGPYIGNPLPNHLAIAPVAVCNLIQSFLLIPEEPHRPLTYRSSIGFTLIKKIRAFCLKHGIWRFRSFETTQFSQNVLIIGCNIFFWSYRYLFEVILHVKDISGGLDVYHLTFGYKSLRVLSLHISNQVLKAPTAVLPFQVFKRSLSDWFGPKCKCKFNNYLNNYSYSTTTL